MPRVSPEILAELERDAAELPDELPQDPELLEDLYLSLLEEARLHREWEERQAAERAANPPAAFDESEIPF